LNTKDEPPGHAAPAANPDCCVLTAHAATSVPVEAIPDLRRQLAPPGGAPLPANFLKQADEQTYAGLSAVFAAISSHGLSSIEFRDWGVVGAPSFLGRAAMSASLPRFLVEGAWDVSPHMIPHRSLHATSGSVSQALGIHGPNFGAGGGPNAEVEGLLAAVALLDGLKLPGVWLVSTWLDPELSADRTTGRPLPGTRSCGLAVALVPGGHVVHGSGIADVELSIGKPGVTAVAFNRRELVDLPARLGDQSTICYAVGSTIQMTLHRRSPVSESAAIRKNGPHFGVRMAERSLTTH
jgi:hypothetical protein